MTIAYVIRCDGTSEDCLQETEVQFSPKRARNVAKRTGWKRVRENGKILDLCPICYLERKGKAVVYVPVTYP
jgi:hypothetical protein